MKTYLLFGSFICPPSYSVSYTGQNYVSVTYYYTLVQNWSHNRYSLNMC